MPGESLGAALAEAERLAGEGIGALLTCLGESVTEKSEAGEVCAHYLGVIREVAERRLDAQVSLKLTHLGLDFDPAGTAERLLRIARAVRERGSIVWIDMEQSRCVEPTLDLFKKIRAECDNVGVCLQSYLRRTPSDVDSLGPGASHIRLVKGAYHEPRGAAHPRKRDVDEAYLKLARRLLLDPSRDGAITGIATHDGRIIAKIVALAREMKMPGRTFEFEMLYGINPQQQRRLAREGHRVRVLISYGERWFAWYARRLAERPANVLFVLRSLFGRQG